MKLALVSATAVATLALARPAVACGVPDFGAALAEAFKSESKPIALPMLELGIGDEQRSVAIGYGWGVHDDDWLFSGSSITRVMVDVRRTPTLLAYSLTYGWFQNKILSTGFDMGAEATSAGELGPTGRLTLGLHGIDLQLRGAVVFGPEARAEGSAQLALDVMDLIGRL